MRERKGKGKGRMSTLVSFPTPHFYFGSLNFYWLKSNKTFFFLIFLFDRSSSFRNRNNFACSNAPNRSVNRYNALKLFLCFGSSWHSVVRGHALHPVPIVILHPTAHIIITVLLTLQTLTPSTVPLSSSISIADKLIRLMR